jgi:hypothetical protein
MAGLSEDLDEATRDLKKLDEEKAVQVLTRALDRGDATPNQQAEIYVLLAIARNNLRDEEGARLAFRRALEANTDVALPKFAAPKTRQVFDEVKAKFEADRIQFAPPPAVSAPAPAAVDSTKVSPATSLQKEGVTPPTHPSRVIAWVGLGCAIVGTATGGIGVEANVGARSLRAQAVAESDAMGAYTKYQQAVSQNNGGIFLDVAAGVLLAGGATLIGIGLSSHVSVAVAPNGAALTARW